MQHDRILVGVDAGGSSLRTANIRPDGRGRSEVTNYRTNLSTAGVGRVAEVILDSIRSMLQGKYPDAIAVGAAGAGRLEVAQRLHETLAQHYPDARIAVVDDARIALRGAIAQGDGVALIAGTGSIAYAEVAGARYRSGGWGYALGDEGSGYAIGGAALRLLMRSFEGRVPSDPMLESLKELYAVSEPQDVVRAIYNANAPPSAVAAAARIVIEFADRGERSAAKIVQGAAGELFELVRAVWRAAKIGDREVPIALCGGLLNGRNSMLTFLLETRLANEFPQAPLIKSSDPLDGALALAAALLES